MRTERVKSKPEAAANRRAEAATSAAARDRIEAQRLARELADMREDRDRWRTQAERLTTALERLKAPPAATQTLITAGPSPRTAEAEGELVKDLLYGVLKIATAFNLRPRQVYHLADKHGLPTFKTGRVVCASRKAVATWIAERGAAAAQGGR